MSTRILIVDDSEPWRFSVRSILRRNPSFEIIGEAHDGIEAIDQAARLLPDLVLLDIGMPRLNGIEAAREIKRQAYPEATIVFLTQENDSDLQNLALDTGAAAYLLKSRAASELLLVIEAAMLRRKPQPHQP